MKEINEGYEIIAAEAYRINNKGRKDRIVLGRKETRLGTMFVTWESLEQPQEDGSTRLDYFWGHYHSDGKEAYADYHRRLLEHYE